MSEPRLRRPAEPGGHPPLSVLLLHGMGGGPSDWDALSGLLPPHLELWDARLPWAIAADPAWAREDDATGWISAPVARLRPDVVVAHSFAANLVLELLTDPLARTPSVLISPFYRGAHTDLDPAAVAPVLRDCYARLDEEIRARRGSRVSDEIRQVMVRRAFELMGNYPPLRFYEAYQRSSALRLENVTAPTLLIGGADDVAATVDGLRLLDARMPRARLAMLDGCGHFPMTDRPGDVARLIEGFLDPVAISGLEAR